MRTVKDENNIKYVTVTVCTAVSPFIVPVGDPDLRISHKQLLLHFEHSSLPLPSSVSVPVSDAGIAGVVST